MRTHSDDTISAAIDFLTSDSKCFHRESITALLSQSLVATRGNPAVLGNEFL